MISYPENLCLDCGSRLKFSTNAPSNVTIYSHSGSEETHHRVKECTNQECRTHYSYSYFTRKNVFYEDRSLAKFFYEDAANKKYFLSSFVTAFMTSYLITMLTDMMLCPEYSFEQKATSFNLSVPSGNVSMNPKRLIEAFMQYALLKMLTIYQPALGWRNLLFSFDVDKNLLNLFPQLKKGFQKMHSKHFCDTPGCRLVLGWDADCKVNMMKKWFDVESHRLHNDFFSSLYLQIFTGFTLKMCLPYR